MGQKEWIFSKKHPQEKKKSQHSEQWHSAHAAQAVWAQVAFRSSSHEGGEYDGPLSIMQYT